MNIHRQFDIILFDLEGTLVDFQWRIHAGVDEALGVLKNAGIDPSLFGELPTYADVYNKTQDIVCTMEAEEAKKLSGLLTAVYDKYDLDALSRWKPYPDTKQILEQLAICGYRMGIVSNCGAFAVNAILKRFNFPKYFEIIISRNDVKYLKPHPHGLNMALEKFCAPAERTLFIGDSLNDILAADRVPMPSCFLSNGESLVTGESADFATFQITSIAKLPNILIN
ncbi:MAG: HAD family hydrolase [Desulfobacteraceae bacterium]|nr:HAD family hydrolase [Desulfobacteraceae bacterium]